MVFAIHQYDSAIGIHMSPLSRTASHLPSHSVPLGCHRTPALGALLHTPNMFKNKYNSPTIKLITFKCGIQWVLVYLQGCIATTTL